MFDIFRHLGRVEVLEKPDNALKEIQVCKEDGFLATQACESVSTLVPKESHFMKTSPYRKLLHLDKTLKFRVTTSCINVADMRLKNYFVLPAIEGYYYKKYHHDYENLPPFKKGCQGVLENNAIEINYPVSGHSIYLPQKLDGDFAKVTLKAMHQKANSRLYWHLDERYVGETIDIHERSLYIKPGKHKLLVMDQEGNHAVRVFKVLSKDGTF